ncbi:MAG TPA: ABC transporter ATP-binding protein [Candidatus Scatomorpha stercoravium]|nr:ABC transporter ATP-binding protein [Candidatus Scatomorpha stercoravium]
MNLKAFKRLFKYLGRHKLRLVLVMLAAVLATVFTVLAPAVTGGITSELYAGVAGGEFDWEAIIFLLIALVALYLVSQLFTLLQNIGMTKLTARVMQSLRSDIDAKMHSLKLSYYDTHTHGEILSTITNDVDTVNSALSQNLTAIVTEAVTAIGILVMMLALSPSLALIAIAMVPVSLLASMGVMRSGAKRYAEQQELIGRLNGCIEEFYNGQELVSVFNYTGRAREQFEEINSALRVTAEKAETASGKVGPITDLVNNLGYALSAVLGCLSVLRGGMLIGDVQAMLQYTKQFSQPFTSIAGMAGSFGAAGAAAGRIFALLDAEEETPDPEPGSVPERRDGAVEFRHVAFGYTPERQLMRDVNFTVKPGQKVAVVGPTGAGKTTLINLLMRFYDVDSGAIYVDGVDTRSMTRHELRDRFGMVLQDAWLFEGTVRENIGYAEDGMSGDKIKSAAKNASVDGFIRTLPGGYDFVLDAGAENVSQGQRQLLTIARAMASDPEIMILDEATSNVDTHTEQLIQNAMNRLMRGRTSFVIAHRLSTIRDADMILYMENGDILEQGTHEELLARSGKYAALYMSQFA